MYSNTLELSGLALIAWGVGMLLGTAAGLICGGIALLLVGATTDDAQVTLALKRAAGWVRFRWYRRLLIEDTRKATSPHPSLRIDPHAQAEAKRLARMRMERAKTGDRTAAMSQQHEEVY